MKDVLTFMSENPWLTFFLVLMVCQTMIYVAASVASIFTKK